MPFGLSHDEMLLRIVERAVNRVKERYGESTFDEITQMRIVLFELVHPEILQRWLIYSLERKAVVEVPDVAHIIHPGYTIVRTIHFPRREKLTVEEYLTYQAQDILSLPIEEGAMVSPLWEISPKALVRRGAILHGEGLLEEGSVVSFYSYLKDCTVRRGALVREFSHCVGAVIGEDSVVGPYARIREGTVLGKSVRIGNFVEVKNSKIAEEVNANHLSYIGDAVVERKVNIGAGTITCNYDGIKKNPTYIGEESFIGSNTALVAPIKIEDHVVVGAGSTLTKDVPSWSLSVARGKQVVIRDWAKGFYRKVKERKRASEGN